MKIKIEINRKTEIEGKIKIETKMQIINNISTTKCNKFSIGNIMIKYNKV